MGPTCAAFMEQAVVTEVTVNVPGPGRQSGSGTLEYFEFK